MSHQDLLSYAKVAMSRTDFKGLFIVNPYKDKGRSFRLLVALASMILALHCEYFYDIGTSLGIFSTKDKCIRNV